MGQQPHWANTEPAEFLSNGFIQTLLSEDPAESLITRSYAIVELPPAASEAYSRFHDVFEEFSRQDEAHKLPYAFQQFSPQMHSPNQFHGFSVMEGLKEQFMMRLGGEGTSLALPSLLPKSEIDFGVAASQVYIYLDQICRVYANRVLDRADEGRARYRLNEILDPLVSDIFLHPHPPQRSGEAYARAHTAPQYTALTHSIQRYFGLSACRLCE